MKILRLAVIIMVLGNAIPVFPYDDRTETQWIVDPEGSPRQRLGCELELDSPYLFAGAPASYSNPVSGSQVVIFEKIDGVWTFSDRIESGHPQSFELFGYSIASDGNRVLVGAPESNVFSERTGAAFLFERDSDAWIKTAEIGNADLAQPAWFGASCAITGHFIVLGAPLETAPLSYAGAAYGFQMDSGEWIQTARWVDPEPASYGYFGYDVAMSEEFIVIGAPGHGDNGGVFVYGINEGTWAYRWTIESPDAGYDSSFGYAIALEGDRLIVSAPLRDVGGIYNVGSIYVFEYDGMVFNLVHTIVPSDGTAYTELGRSVGLSGDRLVTGSPNFYGAGASIGIAFVFDFIGGDWIETSHLLPHDGARYDSFGAAVAIDGSDVVCGAPQKDSGQYGPDCGVVYCYDLTSDATPVPTFTPVPVSPTPTSAPYGDMWSHHQVCVFDAGTEPRVPIEDALVEESYGQYGSYDECVTGASGCCSVSVYCHDTHYVGIQVSAAGYRSVSTGCLCSAWKTVEVELVPLNPYTPTPTPSPPPTSAPSMTPTVPPCCDLDLDLIVPRTHLLPGDEFYLDVGILSWHPVVIEDLRLFIVLDVQGAYWFWPSWRSVSEGVDYGVIDCPPTGYAARIIDSFNWPEGVAPVEDVRIWGAVLEATGTYLISDIRMIEIDW